MGTHLSASPPAASSEPGPSPGDRPARLAGAETGLPAAPVIGLPVTVGRAGEVVEEILRLAAQGGPGTVCVANVHMLVTARQDPALRAVLERATLVVADGRPLSFLLRRGGAPQAEQLRGPDMTLRLCREAARRHLPVYFYGGDEALAAALRASLLERVPALIVAGIEAAPMLPPRPGLDAALAARIRASGARLVFVGLGCPKQEHWMDAHAGEVGALCLGVGQAFGIIAGHVPQAPRWMQRSGLEWLFRLLGEPRRLWRRYLVGNTRFVAYALADLAARRSAAARAPEEHQRQRGDHQR
jgi:N-acetylglucosaminyldiphosphoundecaprenol N-acetyl-beta-D-mannosaminyltransferase